MSVLEPPTTPCSTVPHPEGELDHLLRSFFRAKMPAAWPALNPPAEAPRPQQARALSRSRLALAAAVALLLGGQIVLSRFYQKDEVPASGGTPAVEVASPAHKKSKATYRDRGPEFLKDGVHRPTR